MKRTSKIRILIGAIAIIVFSCVLVLLMPPHPALDLLGIEDWYYQCAAKCESQYGLSKVDYLIGWSTVVWLTVLFLVKTDPDSTAWERLCRGHLRKIALGFLIAFTMCTIPAAYQDQYVARVRNEFFGNVCVLAPFISDKEEEILKARFVRVRDKQSYGKLLAEMRDMAIKNNIPVEE